MRRGFAPSARFYSAFDWMRSETLRKAAEPVPPKPTETPKENRQ